MTLSISGTRRVFPLHGWIGVSLAGVFWILNWTLEGPRTHWGFFPMWLGYCLAVDGLVYLRKGTSLLKRSWRRYVGLFLLSAPVWWLFEALNQVLQNWTYLGGEMFSRLEFTFWSTLSFTTVMPAVFGSAELVGSFDFWGRLGKGPVIRPDRRTTRVFFAVGWMMLALMLAWPKAFFPFVWISIYFILEPVNVWMGNPSLAVSTGRGDWKPVLSLWLGALLTAFFWEMWNFFSFPKWIYSVPWGDCCHIFEMPLLGYGGYLPFALELFAVYQLAAGLLGKNQPDFIQL